MYMTWHSWGLIVVIMVALRADMPAGITLHDERSWHKESCCRWDRRSWCGVLLRWLAASASTDWLWSCSVAESAVKKRDAHVELQSWNHMQSGAIKKKKKRRWAPISWFTFMQKSFSYVHNCSVQPHYFSVDWADRVICSAIPQKKQVFSHVCVWQEIHKQNFYIVITPWRLRPPVASTKMYRQPWLCDFYCTIFLVSYCLCNVRLFGSLQFLSASGPTENMKSKSAAGAVK